MIWDNDPDDSPEGVRRKVITLLIIIAFLLIVGALLGTCE